MGTNEMLQRSITYEEALLKNYKAFASKVEAPEIQILYSELAQEKSLHIKKLKNMLDSFCKPCRSKRNGTKVWTKSNSSPEAQEELP